ncbi:hypothetical protein TCAL_16779 [Tigriopus californicus]|uniref:PDZ domain-containing protein n=1 Tax=Tigriopus californicus TaxID=6832 RepID=A0A553PTZ2_TIGCA|nr:hypothetical protein TCAL_16779 [Tigriopus californicus]
MKQGRASSNIGHREVSLVHHGPIVNHGSQAEQEGLREGDFISAMNGVEAETLTKTEAHMIQNEHNPELRLKLNQ